MDAPPPAPAHSAPPPPSRDSPSRDWNGGINSVGGVVGFHLEPDAETGYVRRGVWREGAKEEARAGMVEWPWEARGEFQRQNLTIEVWVNPAKDQDRSPTNPTPCNLHLSQQQTLGPKPIPQSATNSRTLGNQL